MNTKENNRKNIKKMEQMNVVFDDGEKISKIDEVTAEPPLKQARRIAAIIAGLLWLFAVISIFSGANNFTVMLPFLMISLGVISLLNVPRFMFYKKRFDTVIAVIAGVSCIMAGISLFIINPH